MPTYQYSCTECGHFLEAVQSFSEDSLTECPACGGKLRKVFNAVGVVFKGSGFYRNDSRDAGKSTSTSTSTTADSKPDTTSKPDAPAAAKDGAKNGSTNGSTNGSKPAAKTAAKSA